MFIKTHKTNDISVKNSYNTPHKDDYVIETNNLDLTSTHMFNPLTIVLFGTEP